MTWSFACASIRRVVPSPQKLRTFCVLGACCEARDCARDRGRSLERRDVLTESARLAARLSGRGLDQLVDQHSLAFLGCGQPLAQAHSGRMQVPSTSRRVPHRRLKFVRQSDSIAFHTTVDCTSKRDLALVLTIVSEGRLQPLVDTTLGLLGSQRRQRFDRAARDVDEATDSILVKRRWRPSARTSTGCSWARSSEQATSGRGLHTDCAWRDRLAMESPRLSFASRAERRCTWWCTP